MRSIHSRLAGLLLAIVLLFVCVAETATPVRADYENTYKNTGDQRADLIGVALTQVGYREGYNNYTKYGVWYGAPNTAWCGMFVSWCANQAGIPTSVLRKNGFASASGFGISAYYISDRTPRSGDLFFKTDGSHTGIVYYVEGDYFYTIEGNTSEYSYDGVEVCIRRRSLYGSYYFGAPNYQSDSGHSYVRGVESTHPHKEYYKCSDCGSMYYTGAYGKYDGCQQCRMESCSHSYGKWDQHSTEYHLSTCSLCGKQDLFSHDWGSDRILLEATCETTGSKWQKCRKCAATRTVEIPVSDDHPYGEWEYVDTDTHVRVCETCGHEQTGEHAGEQWYTGVYEHWFTCEDCGGRAGIGQHDHGGSCDNPCVSCDYTVPGGHSFSQQLVWDEQGHYYVCSGCGQEKDRQEHVFLADCDAGCEDCGYTRETEHSFDSQWQSNENGHWYSCQLCGQVEPLQPHVMPVARNGEQTCSVCGYRMRQSHKHSFTNYSISGDTHTASCECGATQQGGSHIWDLGTGRCALCAAALPAKAQTPGPELLILPTIALVAAGAAAVIGICKKKKHALQRTAEE